jgi:hypothetical protein
MITSRRKFLFGATAVAAPTIIGIDGVMKFFTPPKLVIRPTRLIVPLALEDFTTDILQIRVRERWTIGYDAWRLAYGTLVR